MDLQTWSETAARKLEGGGPVYVRIVADLRDRRVLASGDVLTPVEDEAGGAAFVPSGDLYDEATAMLDAVNATHRVYVEVMPQGGAKPVRGVPPLAVDPAPASVTAAPPSTGEPSRDLVRALVDTNAALLAERRETHRASTELQQKVVELAVELARREGADDAVDLEVTAAAIADEARERGKVWSSVAEAIMGAASRLGGGFDVDELVARFAALPKAERDAMAARILPRLTELLQDDTGGGGDGDG